MTDGTIPELTEQMLVEATMDVIEIKAKREAEFREAQRKDRRDCFAAAALTGIAGDRNPALEIARDAVELADALIKELDEAKE